MIRSKSPEAVNEKGKRMKDGLLAAEAAKIGIELTQRQLEQFARFYYLVLERNKKFNLTAITDERDFIVKHFIDSLYVLKLTDELGITRRENDRANETETEITFIDIGSGAGFPGIPLAIARPEIMMTLLEANRKKVGFMTEAAELLKLGGITCVRARAEEAGRLPSMREYFDVAVGRAVAPLRVLAEYCLPFVKAGGFFFAYKGPDAAAEASQAEGMIKELGGVITDVRPTFAGLVGFKSELHGFKTCSPKHPAPVGLKSELHGFKTCSPKHSGPVEDAPGGLDALRHHIVVIKKVSKTPGVYPRANKKIVGGAHAT